MGKDERVGGNGLNRRRVAAKGAMFNSNGVCQCVLFYKTFPCSRLFNLALLGKEKNCGCGRDRGKVYIVAEVACNG